MRLRLKAFNLIIEIFVIMISIIINLIIEQIQSSQII
jgi:hypothetical protein